MNPNIDPCAAGMVENFDQWKSEFLAAQNRNDLVFIPTNGAIANWNNDVAKLFTESTIRTITFTCDDFMVPFATFGITKVAEEQGAWAATTALEIIHGKKPIQIPIKQNQLQHCIVNEHLSKKLNFNYQTALSNCQAITKTN